ncbi:MAG: hypothetical protein MUF81_03730 [Verrucomicrobia bacterium]|jgi:uncharacterized membrane protein YkvA (DUF1232 family)|nr:hypothetical protein [Verrucomicrobiota bacterium]
MPEIVKFVNNGAASITPAIMEKVLRQLPQWKLEFTQIQAPLFPHLVDQLEFLANAVEDAAEGVYKELPYSTIAQSVFALIYAHKKLGIIPDSILNLGYADDSSVVRAVLIQNEKAFAIYAGVQDVDWQKITSQP